MGYAKSSYGSNPISTSPNGAKARGWGSGWPNCQVGKMKTVSGGDIRVTVREEIAEMVMHLLNATDKLYNLKSGQTGAYNCRPIAGTNIPSNHSWGLAIDINWLDNPYSYTFKSEIPPAVVKMWNDCGWYWGGFYRGRYDTMHFEYVGTPSDVKGHTAEAKAYANPAPKPPVVKPPVAVVVALSTVLKAANTDPSSVTGKPPAGSKDMVTVVEKALVAEGYLNKQYVDGLFGSKTVEAYKKWQKELGYTGSDADGTPGITSLKKLGNRHGFEVVR